MTEATKGPTFEVLTLFPEAIEAFARAGLLGKALERGIVALHCTNFRDFATDKHRTVDDAPFGGGPGMVLRPEPVVAALTAVERARGPMHRVLLDPSGRRFDQRMARRFATYRRIALLCGRYEGFDARIREAHVDEVVSLGDFVLSGGEVAALAIVEAVFRLCEGAVGNPQSVVLESHEEDGCGPLLEAPQYTRPAEFAGRTVPEVLRAGDHGAVEAWRAKKARERTWLLRPELRRIPPWRAEEVALYVAVPVGATWPLAPGAGEALRSAQVAGLFGVGEGGAEFAQRAARHLGGRPSISSFRTPAQLGRRMRRQLGGPVAILWADPNALAAAGPPPGPVPEPGVVGGYLRDVAQAATAQIPRALVVALDPDGGAWLGRPGAVPVEPDDPLGLAVRAKIAKAPPPQDPAGRVRHVLAAVRAAWAP